MRPSFPRLFALVLLALLALAAGSVRAQSLEVTGVSVLVDSSGSETIDSVSSPRAQARFVPLTGPLSEGYSRSAHWLRLTLMPPTPGEWWLEVLPPMLDYLTLYEPSADGFVAHQTGDRLPFSSRKVNYRGFVFRLALSDTQPTTLYLRLQTSSVSLAVMRLWSPEEFHTAKNIEYALHGVFYGIFVLVLVLNFTLWSRLQNPLYGWFSLCVLTSMLFFLAIDGFLAQYVFPNFPMVSDRWVNILQLLVMLSTAPFYRHLLQLTPERPFYWKLYQGQWLVPAILLGPTLLGYLPGVAGLARLYSAFAFLMLLGRFFQLSRDKSHELGWLLVPAVLALMTHLAAFLMVLGLVPGAAYAIYFSQGAFFLLMIAMQAALVLRLRALQSQQVSAQHRLEMTNRDAQHERSLHADQARFIAMLSHELKTPLAVIDSAAQALARMDNSNNPEAQRRHERIRRSVGRIDRLVEQLLSKDRLESGMRLQPESLDLCPLLRQIAVSSDEGLSGQVQLEMPLQVQMWADPTLLQLALANLVDNALKYSPAGARVTVTVRQVCGHQPGVDITVADGGPGVPAGLRACLFQAYSRGSNAVQVLGAGLGLYLVQRIVQLHGGQIRLAPSPGGAVFELWFPSSPVPLEVNP